MFSGRYDLGPSECFNDYLFNKQEKPAKEIYIYNEGIIPARFKEK